MRGASGGAGMDGAIGDERAGGGAGDARGALISARGIVKEFPGCAPGEPPFAALRGASLDIPEGQCLVVAGSNGSGKTLLMKIIAGLLEPDGGEVLFRGQALFGARGGARRAAERALRRELGIVFQDADAQIVGQTVEEDAAFGPENLGFGAEETAARVGEALSALGLEGRRSSPPRRLSGGEKRRLAVAGAVASGCRALIMDEPFANLDWPGVAGVLRMIRDLRADGRTLVILTHELEKILALADRLVILHGGRILCDGEPQAVLDGLDPAWGVRDPRRRISSAGDCSWLGE